MNPVPLAANVKFEVSTCMYIAKPFKHLFCATTHSKNLALELQAPLGEKGYHRISNNLYTVPPLHPHFPTKDANFHTLIHLYM